MYWLEGGLEGVDTKDIKEEKLDDLSEGTENERTIHGTTHLVAQAKGKSPIVHRLGESLKEFIRNCEQLAFKNKMYSARRKKS